MVPHTTDHIMSQGVNYLPLTDDNHWSREIVLFFLASDFPSFVINVYHSCHVNLHFTAYC